MEKIFKFIEENIEEGKGVLADLCSVPTVSARGDKKVMEEGFLKLKSYLNNIGAKVRIIDRGKTFYLLGEIDAGKDKTVLFYNHLDVQPEDPLDKWETPPFELVEKDGKWFARGVDDDKGNLVSRIFAVSSFLKVKKELPVNVKFFVDGEEEIGSPNLKRVVEENKDFFKDVDLCIWESGEVDEEERPVLYFGLKGIIALELKAFGPDADLHSSVSAIVPSPIWKLVWALNSLKDKNEKILIEGFYNDVKKPSDYELRCVDEIPWNEDYMKKKFRVDRFVLGLKGKELKRRLIFEPSLNIQGFGGGYLGEGSKTVLPSYAFAKIDIRLVPEQKAFDIYEKFVNHLKKNGFEDIVVQPLGAMEDPARSDLSNRYIQMVIQKAEEFYGKKPVILPNMPGSGPMAPFVNLLKLPVASYGVGYTYSNIHAPNENVRIKDFIKSTQFTALIMDELSKM